jgi:hypothetical protein
VPFRARDARPTMPRPFLYLGCEQQIDKAPGKDVPGPNALSSYGLCTPEVAKNQEMPRPRIPLRACSFNQRRLALIPSLSNHHRIGIPKGHSREACPRQSGERKYSPCGVFIGYKAIVVAARHASLLPDLV